MTISILQWNIWCDEDIRNIVKFLKERKPDIICLQELTINYPNQAIKNTPAYVAEQLGYNYYHEALLIESIDGTPMMLADGIFSRFPVQHSRAAFINQPTGSEGYGNEYRSYVEVILDIGGLELTVGTTHMSYAHKFQVTPRTQVETDLLLAELQKPNGNFIFTGDLNAVPNSYTINSINKVLHNAGPDFAEKTWTTKPFSYQGFVETDLNWRLDYVFTSPDMRIESSEIVATDYSDHLPILTKIILADFAGRRRRDRDWFRIFG